jgi:competence protein ComEC
VRSIFLIISVFLFTALGSLTTYLHLPKNQIQHLVQLDLSNFESAQIQAEVSEILRSNDYSYKYILDNVKIQDKAYRGKVLWQISRDIDVSNLYVGQEVLLFSDLNGFQKAKNPQDFDYGNFMNNRNVYAIIYEDQYVNLPDNNFSINALGATQRQNIVTALDKAGFEDEHLELIQALILGQKQAIDKETYSDFAEVGVVHILAVSGLHVGIVLAILQFLLRPFRRFSQVSPRPFKGFLKAFSRFF